MRGQEGQARARGTSVFQEHVEEERGNYESREVGKEYGSPGVEAFKDIVFIFILTIYADFIVTKQRGMWDKPTYITCSGS